MLINSYIKTIQNVNDFDDQLIFRIIKQSETNPQILSLVCKRWKSIVKQYFSYLANPYLSQWNTKKTVCLLPREILSQIFSLSELSPATLSLVSSKWYEITKKSLDYLFRTYKGAHTQTYVTRSLKKIKGEEPTANVKRLQFIWQSLKKNHSITKISLSILESARLEEIAYFVQNKKAQTFLNFLKIWIIPLDPKIKQFAKTIITGHLTTPYEKATQIRKWLKQEGIEDHLTSINHLEINNEQVTRLPREFKKFSNLKELYLNKTCLSQLKITSNLASLTFLDISQNCLLELPSSISLLKNLTQLNLNYNILKNLPPEIAYLKSLTALYLRQNHLTELPKEIIGLENLTIFDLCQNQFKKFPKIIINLTKLENLGFCCMKLEELSQEIGLLTSLTQLHISTNFLKEIPSSFFCLKQLTELDLSSNLLKTVPDEIGNLENLTSLDLNFNQLKNLPNTLTKLTKLINLFTFDNPLE